MITKEKPTLVCFDTETSGLSSYCESLIEISAVKFNLKGEVIDKFTSFLDPMKEISEIITKITGITNDDLRGSPPFWEVLRSFAKFIKPDDILFAHNARFDANFVGVWISKIMDDLPNNPIYDTIALAKRIFPGQESYKLAELVKNLELEGENTHRAEDDVMATISLIRKCFDKAGIHDESQATTFLEGYSYQTFNQYAIKRIKSFGTTHINLIYCAINQGKDIRLAYNYNYPKQDDGRFTNIDLQPLTILQIKGKTYVEGFSYDDVYFRKINLSRIKSIQIIDRKHDTIIKTDDSNS